MEREGGGYDAGGADIERDVGPSAIEHTGHDIELDHDHEQSHDHEHHDHAHEHHDHAHDNEGNCLYEAHHCEEGCVHHTEQHQHVHELVDDHNETCGCAQCGSKSAALELVELHQHEEECGCAQCELPKHAATALVDSEPLVPLVTEAADTASDSIGQALHTEQTNEAVREVIARASQEAGEASTPDYTTKQPTAEVPELSTPTSETVPEERPAPEPKYSQTAPSHIEPLPIVETESQFALEEVSAKAETMVQAESPDTYRQEVTRTPILEPAPKELATESISLESITEPAIEMPQPTLEVLAERVMTPLEEPTLATTIEQLFTLPEEHDSALPNGPLIEQDSVSLFEEIVENIDFTSNEDEQILYTEIDETIVNVATMLALEPSLAAAPLLLDIAEADKPTNELRECQKNVAVQTARTLLVLDQFREVVQHPEESKEVTWVRLKAELLQLAQLLGFENPEKYLEYLLQRTRQDGLEFLLLWLQSVVKLAHPEFMQEFMVIHKQVQDDKLIRQRQFGRALLLYMFGQDEARGSELVGSEPLGAGQLALVGG